DLADLEAQGGDFEPAFGRLVEALRRTAGDDRERIRRRLVALLELPPADDPRVTAARRAMASALFCLRCSAGAVLAVGADPRRRQRRVGPGDVDAGDSTRQNTSHNTNPCTVLCS